MLRTHKFRAKACIALFFSSALVSCGGDDGAAAGGTKGTTGGGGVVASAPVPTTAINVGSMEFAQTHILPETGLRWTLRNDIGALTLVGKRDILALVTLNSKDAINPVIEGKVNGTSLGKIALKAPSALAPTEAAGALYKANIYSATIPASWVSKGLSLTVSAANYLSSAESKPVIGAASKFTLNIVPFYLFGATDANSEALAKVQTPTTAIQNDMYDKWPVSELIIKPFNGGRVTMPSIVVAPRNDRTGSAQPAYLLSNIDQQLDGYAAMSASLHLMQQMRVANGDSETSNLYYGPLVALNAAGGQVELGGGLGGGGGGVGDTSYSGVFIHEIGHAFNLPHANDGYNAGRYPYVGGSTKGSVWGYSQRTGIFLNLLLDKSAPNFNNCAASRQVNAAGLCYKQDPMQGGHEDRTSGFTYGTFSDFNTGKIQQWFEGKTTVDASGKHVYNGGVIHPDASFASGYARWDGSDMAMVEFVPALSNSGLYGINNNLPIAKNVPVHTIMLAYSNAGTPGASKIYAPVSHTGNLIRTFDPSNAQDLTDFTINTSKYAWYCAGTGCDYSLRVTYSDGSVIYRVLKDGFRSWFRPYDAPAAEASNPLSGSSFKTWAINVPGDKAISKIEMLNTPNVWKGLPRAPQVLLTYTK